MKEVFHNFGKPRSDNDLENIIESGLQIVEPHIFNKAGGIPSGPELNSSSSFKNSLKISSLLIDNEALNLNLGSDSIYWKKLASGLNVSEEKELLNILEKSSDKSLESFTIASFTTKKGG